MSTVTSKHVLDTWFNLNTNVEILKLIASQPNFDVNVTDHNGNTLLCNAANRCCFRIVEFLVSLPDINVNSKDAHGVTPLHVALDFDIAKILISAGADVHAETLKGNTPIMFVDRGRHPKVLRMLVDAGASVCHVNKEGKSVLDKIPRDHRKYLKTTVARMTEKIEDLAFDDYLAVTINKAKKISNDEKSKLIQEILATY